MDEIQVMKNDIKIELEKYSKNNLLISLAIFNNSDKFIQKYINKPKKEIIKKLIDIIDLSIVRIHKEYINKLQPRHEKSLSFYQWSGYRQITTYMLTKEFSKNFNIDTQKKLDKMLILSNNSHLNSSKEVDNKMKEFKTFITDYIKEANDSKKQLLDTIKDIKYIINKAPKISKELILYRGENNYTSSIILTKEKKSKSKMETLETDHNLKMVNLKKGDVFKMDKFISFSLAPWIAHKFSKMCCVYRLKIKPNENPKMIINSLLDYEEYEVILPPSKFKVIDVSHIKSKFNSNYKTVFDIKIV